MVSMNSSEANKRDGSAPLVAAQSVFTAKCVMPAGKPRKATFSLCYRIELSFLARARAWLEF